MSDDQFEAELEKIRGEVQQRQEDIAARVRPDGLERSLSSSGVETLKTILDVRGWDVRDGQVAMTEYIDEANTGEHGEQRRVGVVAVVAPVGTGKTLGYLTSALARGERVVVATSTKALQDQIVNEELPRLREDFLEAFGREITFAVLKGKSNYACLSHVEQVISQYSSQLAAVDPSYQLFDSAPSGDDDLDTLREISQRVRLAMAKGDTATLDSQSLLDRLSPETRRTVDAKHSCPARRMQLDDRDLDEYLTDETDPYRMAYAKAMRADVVVLNTALLVEEVKKQNNSVSSSVPYILEGVGVVIIDEAHHAPNIVAESFSARLNTVDAMRYAKAVDHKAGNDDVSTYTKSFLQMIDEYDRTAESNRALAEAIEAECGRFLETMRRVLSSVNLSGDASLGAVADFRENVVEVVAEIKMLAARRTRRGDKEDALASRLSVTEIDGYSAAHFELSAVPIDVSFFRDRLVSAMEGVGDHSVPPRTHHKTIVLSSGTMSANIPRLLGLGGGNVVKSVPSPFDPARARLCAPSGLPDPTRAKDAWEVESWKAAREAIVAAGGRTLFLCTSKAAVERFADKAREDLPFRVLTQYDNMSRAALIREFTSDEESVLVATMGYWEGIDVPGPALSLVVMDKIPFPMPGDPIISARRDWVKSDGGDAFMLVDVSHASTMLAQGAGRLIRAEDDCGGVLILDSRIATKRYGKAVLAQVEPRWLMYNDLGPFVSWMEQVAACHESGDYEPLLAFTRRGAQPIRPSGTALGEM